MFHDTADILGKKLTGDKRSYAVMDQYNCVFIGDFFSCFKSSVYRELSGAVTADNLSYLGNMIFFREFCHVGDPVTETGNDNGVNVLTFLEFFQCMDDDRFAEYFQKLFWFVFAVHPAAGSSGKYDSYIHMTPQK